MQKLKGGKEMYYPSLEEAKVILKSGDYKQIPISREILSDVRTPINVLRALQNVSHNCFILESAEDNKVWGRYTFLGYNPSMEINGIERIRDIIKEHKSPRIEGLPTFTGGLVGYFSYDFIKYSEPSLVLDAKDEEGFKDIDLMLFNQVIVFDNYKQKMILITNIPADNIE